MTLLQLLIVHLKFFAVVSCTLYVGVVLRNAFRMLIVPLLIPISEWLEELIPAVFSFSFPFEDKHPDFDMPGRTHPQLSFHLPSGALPEPPP